MKKRQYVVKFTKTGKEWKEFTKGIEWMDDNKHYRLEWTLNGFWTTIREYWGIARKHRHTLTIY